MLIAEKLHKRFGDHVALQSLDLRVDAGEVYALLGPNGAGKTTTVNCFLGFVTPDGGRVLVDGVDPAIDPQGARALLAYIPEQVNLYPQLSGDENLAYFAELGGRRTTAAERRSLLTEAGLQEQAFDQRISGYSKGMRQKVGVAIALAKHARGLLLDEPTSGLDPSASYEFSRLLEKLALGGVAVLMATHDIFRARDVASRVGIMRGGVLRRELPASEISATELEALYLGEMA
ncbi:MAG: ABC transporter ATP-binding protein [Phenylobacterium sp.]|uniref:ABC transporter ATP-binding protein n=1 Tax=Phenylobacterium sp. TaxID=1871053 RepID=UPI0027169B92|nr:ABC transporter ATP-binding protein [Phenylobacterium sp.]MDO8902524.1 ABC transporter ATP-binding protein [Phenylobacterium sp.]